MSQDKKIEERLAAPFPFRKVSWRISHTTGDKTKGMVVAYVDARTVSDRLDEVLGAGGWSSKLEPIYEGGLFKGFLCSLTVNIDGVEQTRTDIGTASNTEPFKGAASDALKRAAVHFGVGRYIYEIDNQWVALTNNGKKIAQNPKLPDWAIPENERGKELGSVQQFNENQYGGPQFGQQQVAQPLQQVVQQPVAQPQWGGAGVQNQAPPQPAWPGAQGHVAMSN